MQRFIMVIGLPGSGKDTYIKKFTYNEKVKYTVISSDEIRKELYGDESVQTAPAQVFELAHKRTIAAINKGENVIFNATNISSKYRKALLDKLKPYKKDQKLVTYAVIIGTTYSQCVENDLKRKEEGGRYVGEDVIRRMYYSFEPPHYFEGFNRIEVYYPFTPPFRDYEKEIKELKKISHDNPWHQYSIGEHINRAAKMAKKDIKKGLLDELFFDKYKDYYKSILPKILFMHDLGKKDTKVFDENGIAHYYNHANVGAYNYMFYKKDNKEFDAIEHTYDCNIAAAIAYHMKPHNWSKKTEEKYYNLWGFHLFNLIKAVNIYDQKSEEETINKMKKMEGK